MGIFSKKRTLTDDKQEGQGDNEGVKKKGGLLAGLFGSDKYRKTPEQKAEEREAKSVPSRLSHLKLKKYNRPMGFRYNKNKKRIEVGENFEMKKLPGIIYLLADGSGTFRKSIRGIFDLRDRSKLERIIGDKGNKVRRLERKLNEGNERRQKISLGDLF